VSTASREPTFRAPASVGVLEPCVGWFCCECGHRLYQHSARRNVSQSGLTYYGCRECECEAFGNADGQGFVNGELSARSAQP